MATDTHYIIGLDEVLKNIQHLEPELQRRSMAAGATAGASIFRKSILSSERTPEDTGALKRAVTVRRMTKSLAKKAGIIGSMVHMKVGGKLSKKQANDRYAWYWFLLEYGWFPGGRWRISKKTGKKTKNNIGLTREGFRAKNKKTRDKYKGKRYIRKSFDSKKDSVMKAYEKRIAQQVKKYRGS